MATINPFQAPINYAVDVQSPFEAALGGFKLGAGVAEARAQVEAQRQATQNQQVFETGLRTFFANPDRKFEDLESILPMANKQQFDALQAIGKNMGERRLESAKLFSGQLLAALESNPTFARSMLEQRIQVETDPQQRNAFETTLKLLDVSPTQAAQMVEYTGMGAFGKDWYDNVTKIRAERRAAAEAPAKLKEAAAKAKEAESKARVAFENETNDIAKAAALRRYEQAKADREEAEARVAAGTVESRIAKAAEEAKPAPGFAIIPEAERVRLGLPAGVYQQNLGTKEIKPVSKEPLVSVSVGQQGQRDMLAMKELDVPRAQEFSAAAASARTLARDSRVIADLLRGKGGGSAVKLTSDFAKTLGFETDTVRANDLANSLAIRGATQLRPPGSGSTSDIEFKAFVSAFPSLANSEGGRDLMAKYAEAFATRSAKLADHARKLIREDKYTEEEIARFDTSLGSILGQDFYSGARVRAPAAPAAAAPAPAASAPPTSGTLTPAEQAELQQLRSRFGRVGQ
jgi:hypothetical protein